MDRSSLPALYRNLDLHPIALSVADHFVGAGAGILRLARDTAFVFLGFTRGAGARGIPARAQLRIHPGGAGARRIEHGDYFPSSAAKRHGGDDDVPAVHYLVVRDDADRARLPGVRSAARLALAR